MNRTGYEIIAYIRK